MNKKCLTIIAILVLAIGAGIYRLFIFGEVIPGNDGRMIIQLEAAERDLVLAEMRAFLNSAQQITEAVVNEDMTAAASSARAVGRAAQGAVPGSLMRKLPLAFKQLGFDTHTKFDQLALDAEQFGDPQQALLQLTTLMKNCVACHAAFRIDTVEARQ